MDKKNRICYYCMRKADCFTESGLKELEPNKPSREYLCGYDCGVPFTTLDEAIEFVHIIGKVISNQDQNIENDIITAIAEECGLSKHSILLEFYGEELESNNDNVYFEAVEICPDCGCENVYPMWDVNEKGFVAVCKYCGREIFLCDECIHAEDGLNDNACSCNWRKTECGGKCFRGVTRD